MRRILSFILCVMLSVSMTIPAFAEETVDPAIQPQGETGESTAAPDPAPTVPPVVETQPPVETQAPSEPSAPAQCTHNWDAGTGSDATCTEAGTKTFHCLTCGGTKTETTPAKGHSYGEWSATVETHSRTCSVCHVSESGGHTFT